MKNLKIEIEGKSTDDLILALEEIEKHLTEGYLQGYDENDDGNFSFKVEEEEEQP